VRILEITVHIDKETGVVTFTHLVSFTRGVGTDERISLPAEKAVARNAPGGFADCSFIELHEEARDSAKSVFKALTT